MTMKLKPIAPNMTELYTANGDVVLFSYSTPVAANLAEPTAGGACFVRTDEYYSKTTTRHINKWLDGRNAESVPQSVLDELS